MNTANYPELRLLTEIFRTEESIAEECDTLLRIRNKMYRLNESCVTRGCAFTEKELLTITDRIIGFCERNNYIRWDDKLQTYVRKSDNAVISRI